MSNSCAHVVNSGETAANLHASVPGGMDAFRLQGAGDCHINHCTVLDVASAADQSAPHRDAVQIIPINPRLGDRSQYKGAILRGASVTDCGIDGGGGALQGVFAGDGLLEGVVVANNVIKTGSAHQVSLAGLVSGYISNNRTPEGVLVPVRLRPLRLAGGLNVWVLLFRGGGESPYHYRPLAEIIDPADGFDHVTDERFTPQNNGVNLIDFDLDGFQAAAALLPRLGDVNEHCAALAQLAVRYGTPYESQQGVIVDDVVSFEGLRLGIIYDVLGIEGGDSNHPHDNGGRTRYGITAATARAHGKRVETLTLDDAIAIYLGGSFWGGINGDAILSISARLARELFDIAVNSGHTVAGRWLQRALNVLNDRERLYADVMVDGVIGEQTLEALRAYIDRRGLEDGIDVLVDYIASLRGEFHVSIAERDVRQESFTHGWGRRRVNNRRAAEVQAAQLPPDHVDVAPVAPAAVLAATGGKSMTKALVPAGAATIQGKPARESKLMWAGAGMIASGIISGLAILGFDADADMVAMINSAVMFVLGAAVRFWRRRTFLPITN